MIRCPRVTLFVNMSSYLKSMFLIQTNRFVYIKEFFFKSTKLSSIKRNFFMKYQRNFSLIQRNSFLNVSSPGPFDCRSNALSSDLRRFHTTFLTESIHASPGHVYTMN